ncbi:MAG: phosphoglycerate mutase family protein [Clostridiales bacterium]|jgi:hypothetical protein|nr:phosphoglycerate mutase family protein [Clostridiales bacterium]
MVKPSTFIANSEKGEAKLNESLLDLLRGGGYILYVRHGEATVGEDQPNLNFLYYFTQRNLSVMGRRQAIYYGQILRNYRIPISYPILTSPFGRTIETAQLAFGNESVQVDPFWFEIYRLSGNLSSAEQKRILDILQSRLEIIPPQGSNRVIIAHSFPEGIGLGQIPDMGTIIVRPLGQGNGYKVAGRLSLADLFNLPRY